MMRVVGLISGTSLDGIDAAAAEIDLVDEEVVLRPLGTTTRPYDERLRGLLADALPPRATTMRAVCELDTLLGRAFAEAAAAAVDELCDGRADLVASHGQTVHHWVEGQQVHGTLQLGQPAFVAERTGLPVVADLRARDVAAGGQGAPLVSVLDVMLASGDATRRALLNLGGIANATVVRPGAEPVAFDTGPANALLDATVLRLTAGRETHDRDGARAAAGTVQQDLLQRLLEEPYYDLEPPKSTGKELFHGAYLDDLLEDHGAVEPHDLLATLAQLTARTIADALAPFEVAEVLAAGGGTHNRDLVRRIDAELGDDVRVGSTDELGLDVDGKEAHAFALLGWLTVNGMAGTIASCTGARRETILGAVVPGRHGLPAPAVRGLARPSRLRIDTTA